MNYLSCFFLCLMSYEAMATNPLPIDIYDEFDELNKLSSSHILTSTKLKTSQRDAPAAITKITAEQIARFNYRNVAEALRSVPGMVIAETHTSQLIYTINYHGGNAATPRRMNVLIDGVSFYQSGIARIHWELLPVEMDNIFSIEVIRGPAASLYGSNSFSAVVNITTKTPQQNAGNKGELGIKSKVFIGEGGIVDTAIQWGKVFNDTGINLNYFHREDDGFDLTSTGEKRHDSKVIDSINLRVLHELNLNSRLDIKTGLTKERVQEQWVAPYQTSYPDYKVKAHYFVLNYYNDFTINNSFQAKLSQRSHQHQQNWHARVPAMMASPALSTMFDLNPSYALALASGQVPTGGSAIDNLQAYQVMQQAAILNQLGVTTIDGTIEQNFTERSQSIDLQNIYTHNNDFRLIVGFSANRAKMINFDWLFDGIKKIDTYKFFTNIEYSLRPELLMNLGVMHEYDRNSGHSLSPRLALNYHVNNNTSFRYIVSTAKRPPDAFEQFANWRYIAKNLSQNPFNNEETLTYFVKAKGQENLKPEEIISNELGGIYISDNKKINLDIKIFYEKQTLLISEKLSLFNFTPTNNGRSTIKGAEFQFSYKLSPRTQISSAYAYTDIKGTKDEQNFSVNNTFYLSLSHQLTEQLSTNIYYYGLSHFKQAFQHNFSQDFTGHSLDLFDASIHYKSKIKHLGQLAISIHLRHRNNHSEYEIDNFYQNSNALALNTRLSF